MRNWFDLKTIVSQEKSDDSMENTFENIARGQREGRLSDVLDIMVVKIVPTGISCKNDLRIIIRLSERLLCHCGHVASRIARVSCVYFVLIDKHKFNMFSKYGKFGCVEFEKSLEIHSNYIVLYFHIE